MVLIEETRRDLAVAEVGIDPLRLFSERFWIWFYDNRRMKVASLLFFSVRLEDLQWLFEKIFGPMPTVR